MRRSAVVAQSTLIAIGCMMAIVRVLERHRMNLRMAAGIRDQGDIDSLSRCPLFDPAAAGFPIGVAVQSWKKAWVGVRRIHKRLRASNTQREDVTT